MSEREKQRQLMLGKDFHDRFDEDDYDEYNYNSNQSSPRGSPKMSPRGPPIETVHIRELDLNEIRPHDTKDYKNGCKLVVIGKAGTGKSTIIKSILYSKKHIIPVGQVFSGTEDSNGFFGEIFPKSFVYSGLDTSNLGPLENFKKRQKIAKQYLEPSGGVPWAVQVIDDCTYDTKFLKTPVVQEYYKNGRHFRMLHILSLQYCLDIKPEIRVNVDGVFILRETSLNMRKKLWENYGGCVPTLDIWNQLMDELTTDFTAIYINNKSTKNTMEDCIYYFKADPNRIPNGWKFGCKEFWNFHKQRYNETELDPF
jgi:hypothetical protein